jgi:hypothetical protein
MTTVIADMTMRRAEATRQEARAAEDAVHDDPAGRNAVTKKRNRQEQKSTPTTGVNRRQLLKTAATTAAGFGALAATPHALSIAEVMAAQGLGAEHAATLLRMARDIYPHDDFLTDEPYLTVINGIMEEADKDESAMAVLVDGLKDLNGRANAIHGTPYGEIDSEGGRVGILRAIELTPFFGKLRGGLLFGLYNNPDLWPKFGYEGSSWEEGGYIERGYSDLTWLPEGPSEEERIAAVKS